MTLELFETARLRVLQLGLYSPIVPAGAIPPNKYLPQLTFAKEIKAICLQCTAVLLGQQLGNAAEIVVRKYTSSLPKPQIYRERELAAMVGDLLSFICMSTAVFTTVAGVYLERPNPFLSRYGSSKEYLKWIVLLVFVLWPAVLHLSFRQEYVWSYSPGLFIGGHFVFMDNVTIFQTFGSKMVQGLPGWRLMSKGELMLGWFIVSSVALVFVLHVRYFMRDSDALWSCTLQYLTLGLGLSIARFFGGSKRCFHAHHYFNFGLLLPLTRFLFVGSLVFQSVVIGSMIEGISCWGMDPIFHDPFASDTCFATQYWTTMLIMLDEDSVSWRSSLAILHALFSTAGSIPYGRFEQLGVAYLHANLQTMASNLDMDAHTMVSEPSQALNTAEQHPSEIKNAREESRTLSLLQGFISEEVANWTADISTRLASDDIQLLAFLDTVVRGMLAGSNELGRACLHIVGREPKIFEMLRVDKDACVQRMRNAIDPLLCLHGVPSELLVSYEREFVLLLASISTNVP